MAELGAPRLLPSLRQIAVGAAIGLSALVLVIWLIVWRAGVERRLSQMSSELAAISTTSQQEIASLEGRLARIAEDVKIANEQIQRQRRRPAPWASAASSLVVIGVEWREASGEVKVVWNGTGFALGEEGRLASAAHVLQWASNEAQGLSSKGLQSRVVVKLPGGTAVAVGDIRFHKDWPGASRDTNNPSLDLCTFRIDDEALPGLRAATSLAQVGDEVWVVGFPVDVVQIHYPNELDGMFMPTVRRGHVERLGNHSPASVFPHSSLLQLGIPLVGGFSGSPLLNTEGEVVGVATFASHRLLHAREQTATRPTLSSTTRILDPAHVSFAVSVTELNGLTAERK